MTLRMVSKIRIAIVVLLVAYGALCALMYVFQRSLLYFPQAAAWRGGAATLELPTSDGRTLVSTVDRPGADALIYFGGNGDDVTTSIPDMIGAFPTSALYLMHYRGYGGSSGKPTQDALFADALALFDKVHAEHASITVGGRSLGSGVAVWVASQRPAARLILVTPYDSIEAIARIRYPFVPVHWLLLDKFESWKYAPSVTAPTLVIAAEHDTSIPLASTERLIAAFKPGVVTLRTVKGATHTDVQAHPEYLHWLTGGT